MLLVTLDTFRQDHLGCAGHPTVRTPHLDRLERRGLQWPDAVTAIPLTTPSHATMLTGLSPRGHGLVRNRMRLDPSVETLADQLRAAGWRTGAIVSSRLVLDPALGLSRGFDSYEVVEPEQRPASGEGLRTARAALDWLRARGGANSFLWVHFFDAHLPYLAPAPLDDLYDPDYRGALGRDVYDAQNRLRQGPEPDPADVRHLAGRYAAELTFVDTCVGRILRELEGRHPATRVLVVADHGEGLYEHRRYFGHDVLLYETSVRVPFLLAGAPAPFAARFPGRVVPHAARTVDVTPTLLGLAGLDVDGALEGRDLPSEPPRSGDELPFVVETHPFAEKSPSIYAIRTNDRKVIFSERPARREAYDLRADPSERSNVAGRDLPGYNELLTELLADLRIRPLGGTATVDEERGGLDPETRRALESLGYVDR